MKTSWQSLYDEIFACEKCELCRRIHNKVPGQGDIHARLMFIGEGPGADEDMQGMAFVGAAGQLLTKMIAAMGMTREEVYICNIVKCRPPQNRTPFPEEAAACLPYLRQQVALIRPKIIVCLGSTPTRALLGDELRITRERGVWHLKKGVWFMPTYHPAALLRDADKKRPAWEDFKAIRDKLTELGAAGKPQNRMEN